MGESLNSSRTSENGVGWKVHIDHTIKRDLEEIRRLLSESEFNPSIEVLAKYFTEEFKLPEKPSKHFFMVYVEGKTSPAKKYDDYDAAFEEAHRLCIKENRKAFVLTAVTELIAETKVTKTEL